MITFFCCAQVYRSAKSNDIKKRNRQDKQNEIEQRRMKSFDEHMVRMDTNDVESAIQASQGTYKETIKRLYRQIANKFKNPNNKRGLDFKYHLIHFAVTMLCSIIAVVISMIDKHCTQVAVAFMIFYIIDCGVNSYVTGKKIYPLTIN